MKKVLSIALLFFFPACLAFAGTTNLTTYYPPPTAAYNKIKLSTTANVQCSSSNNGAIYADYKGNLFVCLNGQATSYPQQCYNAFCSYDPTTATTCNPQCQSGFSQKTVSQKGNADIFQTSTHSTVISWVCCSGITGMNPYTLGGSGGSGGSGDENPGNPPPAGTPPEPDPVTPPSPPTPSTPGSGNSSGSENPSSGNDTSQGASSSGDSDSQTCVADSTHCGSGDPNCNMTSCTCNTGWMQDASNGVCIQMSNDNGSSSGTENGSSNSGNTSGDENSTPSSDQENNSNCQVPPDQCTGRSSWCQSCTCVPDGTHCGSGDGGCDVSSGSCTCLPGYALNAANSTCVVAGGDNNPSNNSSGQENSSPSQSQTPSSNPDNNSPDQTPSSGKG